MKRNDQIYKLILERKDGMETQKIKLNFSTQVSPLRWAGGKSKIVGQIFARCQKEKMVSFIEPFAGGASVGLSLLLSGNVQKLYLNDLDYGIYAFFTVIKENPDYLISHMDSFIPTKEAFKESKQIIKTGYQDCTLEDAAWHLFVVNRLAFSGILKGSCLSDPTVRWNAENLSKRIRKIHEYSDNIYVFNEDACDFIEKMYSNPNTTMFIDPPYFEKGKELYMEYYRKEDHEKLASLLETQYLEGKGADILITYDDNEYIKSLYHYPEKEFISRKYCI